MLEHNNDTVLSFPTADAASEALNAILECQLLSLSSSAEILASPRWQSEYAVKSFLLQVRCGCGVWRAVCVDWHLIGHILVTRDYSLNSILCSRA
jgi:hypothetical protein